MNHHTPGHPLRSATLLLVLLCLAGNGALAAAPAPPDPGQLIAQAGQIRTTDKARFALLVRELHRMRPGLSPEQQQHLELFDAFNADKAGHRGEAARKFNHVYKHATDPLLAAQARSALIDLYLRERNYLKAYTLANSFMRDFQKIRDPGIQRIGWKTLIHVQMSEQRYKQAEDSARRLEAMADSDNDRCIGRVLLTQARIHAGATLQQVQADYRKAIRSCSLANMSGFANGLRLDWASLMIDESHPGRALGYLDRMSPQIREARDQPLVASFQVTRARAYFGTGQYERARQAALAAVRANDPKSFNRNLQAAYRILYRIASRDGHARRALEMYGKYVAQYKATTEDVKARAMAYQTVRQDVLANRMRLAELSKQNRILELRQSLARKSAENSRLYVLLLLFVLALFLFWAYRIKHSQLRFRKLARHDDLTGVCNRQYFFEQAEKVLHRLDKGGGEACFMIMDMDHFKRINDEYGHASGDVVLKHVAATCQRELRSSDLFGRMGGEEFGFLMPGCSRTKAMEIGDRIRRALASTSVEVRDHVNVTITASIGLACTDTSSHELRSLLVASDEALYAAKRSGRNKLIMHTGRGSSRTS